MCLGCDQPGSGNRITLRLDEENVRAGVVCRTLQVGEVGNHERVARRGGELLHDAGDVKRHHLEAAAGAIEGPQLEQIAEPKRVVADRLPRDEHAVRCRAQPGKDSRRTAADEVGVSQARPARERPGVDPEDVLQIGPDVGVAVIEGGRPRDAWQLPDPSLEPLFPDRPGRSGGDDIGAERQLCVNTCLLVVGRREEAEVDAEGQQQSGHEQAAVDRCATAPRAREQKAAPGARATAPGPLCEPGEKAPAQTQEQQRRPEPQQRRGKEHVDRE